MVSIFLIFHSVFFKKNLPHGYEMKINLGLIMQLNKRRISYSLPKDLQLNILDTNYLSE